MPMQAVNGLSSGIKTFQHVERAHGRGSDEVLDLELVRAESGEEAWGRDRASGKHGVERQLWAKSAGGAANDANDAQESIAEADVEVVVEPNSPSSPLDSIPWPSGASLAPDSNPAVN